jgi:predicted cobalt transporter CbtA
MGAISRRGQTPLDDHAAVVDALQRLCARRLASGVQSMTTIHSLYRPHSRQKPLSDDLAPARGVVNGLLYSLVFWVIVGVIVAFCIGGWMDIGAVK